VKCDASIEHDYKGRHLPSFDEAQQMAELIAMDLGFTRPDGSFGMEVPNSECRRRSPFLGAGQSWWMRWWRSGPELAAAPCRCNKPAPSTLGFPLAVHGVRA
jgi:hypothetical protein